MSRSALAGLLASVLASSLACSQEADGPSLPLEARLLQVVPESVTVDAGPGVFSPSTVSLTVTGPAGEIPARDLRWWSDDRDVAVASPTGLLAGLSPGETFVAAIAPDGTWGATKVRVAERSDSPVTVIAHRGFQRLHPENTVVAFERAFALGADGVELDLRLTRDGVPVVMHDETVDRTTTGTGRVADLTWQQISTLDACSKFGTGWAPCGVPTFAQALAAAQGRGLLVVQLYGNFPRESLARLLDEVRSAGMERDVVFTSFETRPLIELRRLDPFIGLGWITSAPPDPRTVQALGRVAVLVDLREVLADPGSAGFALLRLRGARVDVAGWTAQSEEQGTRAIALGVHHIISDVMLDRHALERARIRTASDDHARPR